MSRVGQRVVFVGDPTPPRDLAGAFDVVRPGDRAAVVDCLETTPVNCVVVDGTESDRVATVAAVRDVAPAVPVIYTTATPDGTVAAAATRAGATEYVVRTGGPSLADRVGAVATEPPTAADVRTDSPPRTGTAEEQAPPVGSAERCETIDDGVIVVDSDRRFVHVNDAFADLVGASRERLVGRSVAPIIGEDACCDWTAAVASPTGGETGHETFETELRRVGGGTVRVEANVTPLSAADPDDVAFVCVVRDVTERRRRADVVTGLLETTRSLFACESRADVSDVVVEAAERVLGFDLATVRLHDADSDDLVLTAVSEASGDQIRDRTRVALDEGPMVEAFRRGEPVLIENLRTNSPHEYEQLQAGMCVPIGDHGLLNVGSPVVDAFDDQHVQLARLLTASAAAALERAERGEELLRHERILETLEGMVYAIDGDARLTLVTDPLAERLGYERDELVGEPVARIFDDESYDRAVEHVGDLLSDDECDSGGFEATYTTADGERFPVEIECSLLPRDDDGEFHGSVSVVRDITQRKEREQYLQVLNRVLRHNLRNDLTVVIGYAELLRERLDDPDLAAAADTLRETATDLAGTSEKTRAIQYALDCDGDLEPVDVAATVTETVEGLDPDDATVSASTADDCLAWADPGLGLVVENLVENAIRHAGPAPTVEVAVAREDCRVRLAVADDGPGIPPAEIDVVTGASDITQLTHSSGLGLWLVRWMVDNYGGSVSFRESDLGGSRVEISLEPAPSASRRGD
ncbi:histidine kinase [Natrinema saccharevitans]|uniref:histidine kinase n=1 Tax=Natrinema saccharevitans TaxID=301967 RepID=A0A1S8ASC8_9EURY|nr:PAS domain-containing sensor histidine kinase [Natrinema saccharevitans]OLZ39703.1 histidine kinase [Natrinema saccharevitans]